MERRDSDHGTNSAAFDSNSVLNISFLAKQHHVLGQFGEWALLDAASPAGPPTHPYKNKTAAYYSILALI
jgi:hypothetical protein